MTICRWRCDSCDNTYKTRQEAFKCCPDISGIYFCGKCGSICINKEDVDDCCFVELEEDEEEE